MSQALYDYSVPVFRQMLGALRVVLAKGEAHATERKINPDALLQARLYPDMFPLCRQVQVACDFAKRAATQLAQVETPVHEDTETTFDELQARIDKTLSVLAALEPAQFDGGEARQIVVMAGTPREMHFAGDVYLRHFALPNFYFHVTTVYDILRHNGVELGKRHFIGRF